MKKRELGNSGRKVAPLALGGNVFGWTADEKTSFRLLDAFTAGGGDLIDTADVYSAWVPGHKGGESETVLGKWLKRGGNREKGLIATKGGMEMGPGKKGLSKPYILRAAEDSLKRLQTDYIDLYQAHADDPETPLEETLEAFAQLIRQGEVRAIGGSNSTADRPRPGKGSGPPPLLPAGRRVPHGKIPVGKGPCGPRARRIRQEIPGGPGVSDSRCAGPGGPAISFGSRHGRSRLVDRAPRHHRSHCERDKPGPVGVIQTISLGSSSFRSQVLYPALAK